MPKARLKVTDEKINLIIRLKPHCKSLRAIARVVNLSHGTVSKILEAKMLDPQQKEDTIYSGQFFNIDQYSKSIITI